MARFFILAVCFAASSGIIIDDQNESLELESRLVGATNTQANDFPFVVSVWNKKTFQGAGIILNDLWILTTVQNVEDIPKKDLHVKVGSIARDSGERFEAAEIKIHPRWNPDSLQYDVTLIKLTKKLTFSKSVNKIDLDNSKIEPGFNATVVGWGTTSAASLAFSKTLQYLNVTVGSNAICEKGTYPQKIETYELCTAPETGKGICIADDGDALVANGKLIGMASWSISCAIGRPDIYIRIASFYDFIQGIISKR